MPGEVKPKCPECETEYVLTDGKPPEKCAKCGFPFGAFSGFNRLFTAAVKTWRKENKTKKGGDETEEGFFDSLRNL